MVRQPGHAIWTILVLCLGIGCTNHVPSHQSKSPVVARSTVAAIQAASRHVSVTCSESVEGPLQKGWQEQSVTLGPIAFHDLLDAASQPPATFQIGSDGRFGAFKTIAVVRAGAVVTVSVPAKDRFHYGLAYGQEGHRDSFLLTDAAASVTFHACPSHETQFSGGIVVVGPRCIQLTASAPGGERWQEIVKFARHSCS